MCCAKGTVYGPSRDIPGGTVFIRADCKKLSCPTCGPKRAARYRFAISNQAKAFKLQRFLTLTLDPKKIPDGMDSVSYMRQCWAKFRVYLGRKYGKNAVSYISIIELHKSGIAHLHILIGVYIPSQWISENWAALGGGYIVKIKLVDIHNVSSYLTKYVTKDLLLLIPAKKKRISTSRNIRLFAPKEKGLFKITHDGINYLWETAGHGECLEHRFDKFGLVSFIFIGG